MEKLNLKITQGKDKTLILSANNMNELIDKIIDWQSWEKQPFEFFKSKGENRVEKEKNSGWYYFK